MSAQNRCCADVWSRGGYSSSRCGLKASVERGGKFYCRRHDPQAVADRRARTNERHRLENAVDRVRVDVKKRSDAVVESVRAATEQRGSWDAVETAMDALRRAEAAMVAAEAALSAYRAANPGA